jgi:phosphotransferase family enzyme
MDTMKQITSYVRSNGNSTSNVKLMDAGLQETLQTFLGGGGSGRVIQAGDKGQHDDAEAVAILTGLSTSQQVARLRGQGFNRFKEFALLPSASSTRWIIPMGDSDCMRSGLNIYMPYATHARALKRLLLAILRLGWTGWARHKVVVASRKPLSFESLVSEVTGEPRPVFAFSLGNSRRIRKLTIQVMRTDGEVLGYLKFPMTPEAVGRIRSESAMLAHLSNFSALRSQIPRVLFAGEWGQDYVLFRTAGSPLPGPAELGAFHQEFLKNLWTIESFDKSGGRIVEEVGTYWRTAEQRLDSGWRDLGRAALTTASQELSNLDVRCGMTHGDFTPWNTCICDGRLFVFDWELAETKAPHHWDIFHFQLQVANLLKRKVFQQLPMNRSSGERALYLLYLLYSAGHAAIEDTPSSQKALACRRRLLTEELSA